MACGASFDNLLDIPVVSFCFVADRRNQLQSSKLVLEPTPPVRPPHVLPRTCTNSASLLTIHLKKLFGVLLYRSHKNTLCFSSLSPNGRTCLYSENAYRSIASSNVRRRKD